ncbi:uncharacterized protein LOC129588557 isoform X2 [Paramacrobiotus metropolitanus]|uniref:uncharacterized protein LOC129588557 isoform X2 n=1 Tax=Paramacrobiotus metropolitanus TaxID=2943436 RepID=UPI00244609E2|nr:uncharacterized protein LOC129588557 isoform X2 [Paramacrobiotus metropolitanus]
MDNDKERTSLQEYLLLSQKRMELPEQSQAIHIVTGNEACDLDSAVSALVYAFHLWKTDSANNDAVLPLLNVPRKDYVLKTEVAYALTKQGIEQSNLIFADDLDPVRLHQERRLQVTLVDHHLPVGKFSGLTDAVKEVIDHRPVEQGDKTAYLKDISSTTETVGSCCTLIAEKILAASDAKSLTPVTAYLLYETIILDTVNFSKDAQKATQKDEHIADELQKRLPTAAVRDQIFSELVDAKSDISCLNTEQLLRKDLKVLDIQEIKIAVSSIPKLVRHCLKADDAQAEIETFCRKYDYTGLIVLGVSIKDTSVQRDMLCFAPDMSYVDLLLDDLNNAEVKLGLERDPTFGIPDGRYQYFKQGNVKASRKQILPVVKQIIEQRLADMHTTGLMESPPRPPSRCGVMENTDDFGDQNGTASTFFATEPISPHGIPPKAAKRLGEMLTPTSTPNTNVTDNADGCYESLYGQIDSDSSIDTENTENSENDMLSLEEALALNKDSIEVRNTVAPSSFLRPLNNLTPNGPVSHSPFPGSDTSGSLDTHCLPTPRQTRTRPHMHLERGDVLDGGSGAGTPVTPGTGTEPVNAGERTGWSSASSLSPATPMAQWSQPPLARPNVSAPEMTGEFLHHDTPKDSEKVTDDHPTENEADTDKENSGDVTVLMDASFSADDSSGAPKSAVGTFHVVTSVVRLQNSNRPRISEVMDVETFPPSIPGLVNEKNERQIRMHITLGEIWCSWRRCRH